MSSPERPPPPVCSCGHEYDPHHAHRLGACAAPGCHCSFYWPIPPNGIASRYFKDLRARVEGLSA